tara:strand:+ start:351 stop:1406 length:1056 start_codon:yes stop_codon:yes gene_type:complete
MVIRDESTSLKSDKLTIPFLPKDYSMYIDKMTTIYGKSNSGKSFLIKEIIKILSPYIPNILVFGSMNIADDYSLYVPENAIIHDLTVDGFKAILARQEQVALLYKEGRNVKKLLKMFDKVATSDEKQTLAKISYKFDKEIGNIKRLRCEYARKAGKINKLNDIKEKAHREYYQKILKRHKNDSRFNTHEKAVIQYFDVNPRMLIVMDDCAPILDPLKKDMSLIKAAFQGRHSFITSVFAMQNTTMMPAPLRQNSMLLLFTTSAAVNNFFDNNAAGQKHNHKVARQYADAIFGANENHHKKMAFIPDQNQFYYTLANVYPPFEFGSRSFRRLMDNLPDQRIKISSKYTKTRV